MYSMGTLACLCVAFVGVLVVQSNSYTIISLGTARFLMGFAAFAIFTQSAKFSQLLQTMATVSSAALPILTSLIAITCLYSRAAEDIFGDKV